MGIGSPVGLSVLEEGNSSHDPNNGCVVESLSTNDLGNNMTNFLHIEDGHELASNSILCRYSDNSGNRNVEKEDECEEPFQTRSKIVTSENCLSKCSTSPSSSQKEPFDVSIDGKDEEREDAEEEDDLTAAERQKGYESVKRAPSQHVSLPSPLNLVSAMKGSRDKQGMPPKKLTVTWAPDVYDPPPSASTFVRIKKARPRSGSKKNYDFKKNGKKKLKGKPCKGSSSSSKDKKQARKHGGSSNKGYRSLDDDDDDDNDSDEPFAALGDFGVGSPNSYCGSSLLEKSSTKLHLSIAEAT